MGQNQRGIIMRRDSSTSVIPAGWRGNLLAPSSSDDTGHGRMSRRASDITGDITGKITAVAREVTDGKS